MDFSSTIDLIVRELEEACDILEDIKKSPHPQTLKIELAKSKCRNASGVIAMLKEMSYQSEKEQPAAEPVNKSEQAEEKKIKKDETPPEAGPEKQNKPLIDNTTKREETTALPLEIEPENEEPEKPFVAPIIADTFSHLARFNEQLGDNLEYQGKTITNLAEAIGVNDRFYYIRELFHGNREEYDNVISRLEKTRSIDEASDILSKYRSGNKDSEALKNLVDLVKRKFTR